MAADMTLFDNQNGLFQIWIAISDNGTADYACDIWIDHSRVKKLEYLKSKADKQRTLSPMRL